MPWHTSRVLRGAAVLAALLCAYGLGAATGHDSRPPRRTGLLDDTAGKISRSAAVPVPAGTLDRAAIDGMLRALGDRWAHYYTASEFDDASGSLSGRYSGVGLWLGSAADKVRIAGVAPGSPADKAGVHAGDLIASVAGRTSGLTTTSVAGALRGRAATGVVLIVHRAGRPLRFDLVRAAVPTQDVTAAAAPGGVLVIRVAAFTRGVGALVRGDVTSTPHGGGIVLDLRGDPGGLLDEAVGVASAFLNGGPVATYERRGAAPERLAATPGGDTATPLVVLVDAGTASAAEVVAGSLRDRDRAVIVGSRTFGKGSVQEPVRLADGSAIELTVGRYRTPSGRTLDGSGIEPDVAVDANRPPREAEQRAQAVLRGLLVTLPTAMPTLPNKDRG